MVKERFIITETQLVALERRKEKKEIEGEIGFRHLRYLDFQDTFDV